MHKLKLKPNEVRKRLPARLKLRSARPGREPRVPTPGRTPTRVAYTTTNESVNLCGTPANKPTVDDNTTPPPPAYGSDGSHPPTTPLQTQSPASAITTIARNTVQSHGSPPQEATTAPAGQPRSPPTHTMPSPGATAHTTATPSSTSTTASSPAPVVKAQLAPPLWQTREEDCSIVGTTRGESF